MELKRHLKFFFSGKKGREELMIKGILESYKLTKEQNPNWSEDLICRFVMCESFKLHFKLKNYDEALDYVDKILESYRKNGLDINTTCYLIITTSLSDEYNLLIIPFEKRKRLEEKIKKLSKEFLKYN